MSEAKVSPKWKLNNLDLKKIAIYTAKFFAAPAILYLSQLSNTNTSVNGFASFKDIAPNAVTMGGIYGWFIGIGINFFLKLQDGKK